ncbi:MAG: hypothetical protein JWO84_492 [Parcubacteria group bacterium]|nr:hypothetical protein [Parcubacteria group bacterium]
MVSNQTFQKVVLARVMQNGSAYYRNPFANLARFPQIPIFFGGGPILGAPQPLWHWKLYDELAAVMPAFILVLPIRCELEDWLVPRLLPIDTNDYFERQKHLEDFYMDMTATASLNHPAGGALLFNFCLEDHESPRNDGNPYAMDTRREAGKWSRDLWYRRRLNIRVAGDPAFPGLSQIEDDFKQADESFTVLPDLGALAAAAAACVKK